MARQRLCGRNGTYPQKSVSEGQRFHDVSMSEGCRRLAADELTTIRERLIKFGSRVDIFLGPEWEIKVRPGERVAGGSSILAQRRISEVTRQN